MSSKNKGGIREKVKEENRETVRDWTRACKIMTARGPEGLQPFEKAVSGCIRLSEVVTDNAFHTCFV